VSIHSFNNMSSNVVVKKRVIKPPVRDSKVEQYEYLRNLIDELNNISKNCSDYDHMMTCVQKRGNMLYLAAPELKSNENIVMAAVLECSCSFVFASDELKCNEEFVAKCLYALYTQNKIENIPFLWMKVDKEIKDKFNNQWQPLMASYYHRVQ
jgi:hypothetical protein